MPMSTPDFFRAHLEAMIDLRHPLAVLVTRMPWVGGNRIGAGTLLCAQGSSGGPSSASVREVGREPVLAIFLLR